MNDNDEALRGQLAYVRGEHYDERCQGDAPGPQQECTRHESTLLDGLRIVA